MILASWAIGRVPGHIEDNALDRDQGRATGVRAYNTLNCQSPIYPRIDSRNALFAS